MLLRRGTGGRGERVIFNAMVKKGGIFLPSLSFLSKKGAFLIFIVT